MSPFPKKPGLAFWRLLTAISLICAGAVLWVCRNTVSAVDDPSPAPPASQQAETPAARICSYDDAVVRNVVYGLVVEERRLYLTSQPLDGPDREFKRSELEFFVPENGEVDELSLSRMGEKNLVAVVKVRRGKEYDYHCLTFIGPKGGGHVRDRHGFCQAKFFSTRDNLRILAVNGKGNVAFVALGKLDWDEESALVTDGVFYFSGCPWPPSDGQLAPFHAKSKAIAD